MAVVLVTGADGFVGRRLMAALVSAGIEVRGAVRGPLPPRHGLSAPNRMFAMGDISDDPAWQPVLEGVTCIVHAAARAHVLRETEADPLAAFRRANVDATRRLLDAAVSSRVRRFIYLSSAGVLGATSGEAALSDQTSPNPQEPYALSKLEAEDHVRSTGRSMDILVLRPPLMYGPENKGNMLRLLKLLATGIPLPFASLTNRRSLLFVDNLASAVACAIGHPVVNGTYLMTDPDALTLSGILQELGSCMRRSSPLVPMSPRFLARLLGGVGRKDLIDKLLQPLVLDGSRFARDFQWKAPVSTAKALQMTGKWFAGSRQ